MIGRPLTVAAVCYNRPHRLRRSRVQIERNSLSLSPMNIYEGQLDDGTLLRSRNIPRAPAGPIATPLQKHIPCMFSPPWNICTMIGIGLTLLGSTLAGPRSYPFDD